VCEGSDFAARHAGDGSGHPAAGWDGESRLFKPWPASQSGSELAPSFRTP
jgi:hypothetical protein